MLITKGKVNIKYLFIVTVIAVIAGGIIIGAFKLMKCPFWWPSFQQIQSVKDETADSSSIASATEDWQTYRNEEYGFEIKYPKELPIDLGGPLVEPNVFYWRWSVYEYAISLVVSDILKKEPFSPSEKTKISEITIDNEKGVRYEEEQWVPAGYQRGGHVEAHTNFSITVDVEHLGKNYRFHLTSPIESQWVFNDFNQMLSTFKFIDNESQNTQNESAPEIKSITPAFGPKGTMVEIRGVGLSGFEGDLDVYFEKADGEKVMLTDTFGDYTITRDKLIKVEVVEPCQKGEKVIGRYSGIESECDYVELTPGVYKVYAEPWGVKSNVVQFTVISN